MENVEARLWSRWQRRQNETAFEELVRPHLRFLRGFARRLGCGAADADDVVQETLVRLADDRTPKPAAVGLLRHVEQGGGARPPRAARAAGGLKRLAPKFTPLPNGADRAVAPRTRLRSARALPTRPSASIPIPRARPRPANHAFPSSPPIQSPSVRHLPSEERSAKLDELRSELAGWSASRNDATSAQDTVSGERMRPRKRSLWPPRSGDGECASFKEQGLL